MFKHQYHLRFLTSILLCAGLALSSIPQILPVHAFEESSQLESSEGKQTEFTEESLEKMEADLAPGSIYEGQYLTYAVDQNNNVIQIEASKTPRSGTGIAVYIGTTLLGYLICTIVDGVVVAATGQSGAWWVGQAISLVLNRPAKEQVWISCSIYPPHSYEGAMCNRYV